MKEELKEKLQCNDCDMPFCDIKCDDLSDKKIDWIVSLSNQRVIEELQELIDWEEEMPLGLRVWIKTRIKELKQ